MIVAIIALVVATTGAGTAATVLLTGKQIKDGTITGADVKNSSLAGIDVKNSSLTGADVKDKSLTAADFNGSVQGPKGDTGPQGPPGAPDTTQFYNKTESDGRFLPLAGKAADADKLDGRDGSGYIQGTGGMSFHTANVAAFAPTVDLATIAGVGRLRAGCTLTTEATVQLVNESGAAADVVIDGVFTNLANAASINLAQTPFAGGTAMSTTLFRERPALALAGTGLATVIVSAHGDGAQCRFSAQVINHSTSGLIVIPPIILP